MNVQDNIILRTTFTYKLTPLEKIKEIWVLSLIPTQVMITQGLHPGCL